VSIVERAKELAHRAHAGQVDKAGRPYIEHVARVAAAVSDNPNAEAVAWLHDVVEDHTDFAQEVWLRFPSSIVVAVDNLTRMTRESAEHYYSAVRCNALSLRVKLADIADNADESRLSLLDKATADRLRRKYTKALKALTD
jgi:(p)ppGpp synthase/HD superfamily hydrolase